MYQSNLSKKKILVLAEVQYQQFHLGLLLSPVNEWSVLSGTTDFQNVQIYSLGSGPDLSPDLLGAARGLI